VKKLRRAGLVPAVCYGRGEKTINIRLSLHELRKILHTASGENVIIDLKIAGKKTKTKTVIIKEVYHDPVKDNILHVDFQHISLTKEIKVKVPIHTKGESPGVKEGGILEHILWEIEIECLPTQIPEKIDVDVSKLTIGDSVCLKDILLPEGIKVIQNTEDLIVQVVAPKAEVVEEVAPEKEVTEPEVIKKERKEEVPKEDEEEEAKTKESPKPKEKPHKE
ncbi:MAG: 50S ribosomal protein L25, partial [Candidatus Omnitrophota bacterium]|nr:50S ribosomal protein L25 [Candidatus Omnitrophota bacterium]